MFRPIVLLCSIIATASSMVTKAEEIEYVPPPAPPIWGDVTRDRNVDLSDLVALSQDWNTAEETYGTPPQQALADLDTRWAQRVPLALHEMAWENRAQTGSVSSFQSLKSAFSSDKSNSFRAIGFGITYPDGNKPPVSGLEVYNVPTDLVTSVRFRGIPSVGYPEDGSLPRYDFPVESEETAMEYMNSYAQELDFTGADLSVEAKYAMFSGSVRVSTRSEFYKNRRNHKVIFKSTKSYGWFYLPDDIIRENLTEGFKTAKDSIDSRSVLEKYGQHYIYAEHRQGDLFVEVTFSTATEQERNSFGIDARASYDAEVTSVNLAASIFKLKSLTRTDTSFTVSIRRRGGPESITFTDGDGSTRSLNLTQSLILAANDESKLQTTIANIAAAWSDPDTGLNSTNAAATDFISRPISDFYDTPSLPWSKEHNLRLWFERYLAFDDQLRLLDDVFDFDFAEPVLREEYRHYALANEANNNPIPGAGQFHTWQEYLLSRRNLTDERYKNTLAAGRQLYGAKEGDDVLAIFDPRAEGFRLPSLAVPQFTIERSELEYTTNQCDYNWVGADLVCRGINFTESNDYEWRIVYNTGLREYGDDPATYQPTRPASNYIEGSNLTSVRFQYAPAIINCNNADFLSWRASGNPGVGIGVYDKTSRNLVAFRCLSDTNCGPADPSDLLWND